MMRKLVGARIQLPVAELFARKHNRNRVRRLRRLRRKQLRQRRTRQRTPGRGPLLQQRATLRRRQYLQPPDRNLGRRYRSLQHTNQPPRQRLNARTIEQVAGVFHHPAEPTDKSNFALAPTTGSTRALSPASSSSAAALFCNANITWNSGWCANERAGLSASTSRSNGSSWWL